MLGGIPLAQIGAPGLGVAAAAEAAEPFTGIRVAGARVAIQGFGAVRKHAARDQEAGGTAIVAASDSTGTLLCPDGIDVPLLTSIKERGGGGSVRDYVGGTQLAVDAIVDVECDIWIPAACCSRGAPRRTSGSARPASERAGRSRSRAAAGPRAG